MRASHDVALRALVSVKKCVISRLTLSAQQAPNPNVDLELDEIDLEECIGRGGHGAVYKVRFFCLLLDERAFLVVSKPSVLTCCAVSF